MLSLSIKTAALVVALLTGVVACNPESGPPVDFQVVTDDGQLSIADYRGEVVYLDFWATWCSPCRDSFPWMRQMQDKYRGDGLNVIAVSLDTDRELALQFAGELSANFIIGFDDTGSLANLFEVKGMPTSVVIDRDGRVAEVHEGWSESKMAAYEKSIEKVLD